MSCGSCAPYLAPSCALFNSVPPRVPQVCSFLSIQDLAVDSRFPLITRACQRWKRLHQHFHGKRQLQRRMGDALTSLAASFLSAARASQGATWILPRRAKPFHSMVYPSGFEPLTDCLEGSCAILLSHGYIYQFNQRETIHVLTSTVALKIASNWQVLQNGIPQTIPAALQLSIAPSF